MGNQGTVGGSEPSTLAGWGQDLSAWYQCGPCPQLGLELPSPSSAQNAHLGAVFDSFHGRNLLYGMIVSEGKPTSRPLGMNLAFL